MRDVGALNKFVITRLCGYLWSRRWRYNSPYFSSLFCSSESVVIGSLFSFVMRNGDGDVEMPLTCSRCSHTMKPPWSTDAKWSILIGLHVSRRTGSKLCVWRKNCKLLTVNRKMLTVKIFSHGSESLKLYC